MIEFKIKTFSFSRKRSQSKNNQQVPTIENRFVEVRTVYDDIRSKSIIRFLDYLKGKYGISFKHAAETLGIDPKRIYEIRYNHRISDQQYRTIIQGFEEYYSQIYSDFQSAYGNEDYDQSSKV